MIRSFLHKSLAILGLLVAAATSLPSVAVAQAATAEQAPNPQAEYRKAHEAARAKNWPEARRILLALWKREKTYDVAASLSEAEFSLGHVAASAQYMDYALRHVTPNESPATIANMKGALEKIRPKVGGAKVIINDPTAQFSVDGEVVELEPKVEVFLDPGQHVLEARAGERKVSKTIIAKAGETQTFEFDLPPAVPKPSTEPGTGPATPTPLAPSDRAEPSFGARKIVLVTGGALAVAGLGMGIGFGVASNSAEGDVEDYRARLGSSGCQGSRPSGDCSALSDAADSQRRNSLIANVGYGVAIVGLVTVGAALLWPQSSDAKDTQASPVELRWTGNGFSLGGTF